MDLFPPTLDDSLAELSRELQKRREVFPRWVSTGKITQKEADARIRNMQHAYDLLMKIKYEEAGKRS